MNGLVVIHPQHSLLVRNLPPGRPTSPAATHGIPGPGASAVLRRRQPGLNLLELLALLVRQHGLGGRQSLGPIDRLVADGRAQGLRGR